MDIEEQEYLEQAKAARLAERRAIHSREDDEMAQQAIQDYYQKPQNEIQFDYLYITPGAPERDFKEWTRDSILSNYDRRVQHKISLCVDQLRVLEMMAADAQKKNDTALIENFIKPLFRFIESEKTAFENTSRNIDGFNAQTSRSQFNTIQQFRYNEELERQAQKKGILSGLKLPRPPSSGQRRGWDEI